MRPLLKAGLFWVVVAAVAVATGMIAVAISQAVNNP